MIDTVRIAMALELKVRLCVALGLDATRVGNIKITAAGGPDPVTIDIELRASIDEIRAIVESIHEHSAGTVVRLW